VLRKFRIKLRLLYVAMQPLMAVNLSLFRHVAAVCFDAGGGQSDSRRRSACDP